jgi:hypothetical protein
MTGDSEQLDRHFGVRLPKVWILLFTMKLALALSLAGDRKPLSPGQDKLKSETREKEEPGLRRWIVLEMRKNTEWYKCGC